ncbi:MAG: hypothetical protein PVH50_13045 [Anaerolineae bacterium]
MKTEMVMDPWWAGLAVWGVVNAVNVLQATGFISRVRTRSLETNHRIGRVIIALGVPAAVALFAFLRAQAGWLLWAGPAAYLTFIALLLVVDYVRAIEFRSPIRLEILVPYLVFFFVSILLMGLPMFWASRQLWLVTVTTTALLLGSMIVAMRHGVA